MAGGGAAGVGVSGGRGTEGSFGTGSSTGGGGGGGWWQKEGGGRGDFSS